MASQRRESALRRPRTSKCVAAAGEWTGAPSRSTMGLAGSRSDRFALAPWAMRSRQVTRADDQRYVLRDGLADDVGALQVSGDPALLVIHIVTVVGRGDGDAARSSRKRGRDGHDQTERAGCSARTASEPNGEDRKGWRPRNGDASQQRAGGRRDHVPASHIGGSGDANHLCQRSFLLKPRQDVVDDHGDAKPSPPRDLGATHARFVRRSLS